MPPGESAYRWETAAYPGSSFLPRPRARRADHLVGALCQTLRQSRHDTHHGGGRSRLPVRLRRGWAMTVAATKVVITMAVTMTMMKRASKLLCPRGHGNGSIARSLPRGAEGSAMGSATSPLVAAPDPGRGLATATPSDPVALDGWIGPLESWGSSAAVAEGTGVPLPRLSSTLGLILDVSRGTPKSDGLGMSASGP